MTLYEKFGWRIRLEDYLNDVKIVEACLRSADRQWVHFADLPNRESNVAVCYYLEGDIAKAQQFAARAIAHCLEYFYGTWRAQFRTDEGTYDPNWWRRNISWMTHLHEAFCWASSLGDWTSLRRLAEYPARDSKPGIDGTREDAAAYLALACLLRDEPLAQYEHCFGIIEKGKKQKPKLVARVIRELQAKNGGAFQDSLEAYLRYFRKSEFKKSALDKLLCFDGTTLLHIGEREGLNFKVPPEIEDHIIRLNG
jgi:hypothetical protein